MNTWMTLVFFVMILAGLFLFYGSVLNSLRREAPYVPTGRRELQWILREVVRVMPGEVFYDLGSGDGRVVRAAAKLGARAVGFEQSWVLTWWSRVLSWWDVARHFMCRYAGDKPPRYKPQDDARFVCGNYLSQNLSQANVIFCYLMPKAMEHLKPKFESELKPGTRIISRAFKIPGWTAAQRLQFSPRRPPVYVYVKQ